VFRAAVRHFEPWYVPYALVGVTVGGIFPILLPLVLIRRGSPADVGLAVAAFSAGSITAPIWGAGLDRSRAFKPFFAASILITGVGITVLGLAPNVVTRFVLGFAAGLGAALVSTIVSLFVVEFHARDEWPSRFGTAQLVYVGGQVVGLSIAGAMSRLGVEQRGLLVSGVITALTAGLVLWTVRDQAFNRSPVQAEEVARPTRFRAAPPAHTGPRIEHGHASVHHLRFLPSFDLLRGVAASPFVLFLGVWFVSQTGSQAVFSMYPVLMRRVFSVDPGRASFAYAFAVSLSLLLFGPAASWARRLGAKTMIRLGLQLRAVSLITLSAFAYLILPGKGVWAEVAFAALVLAWSVLGVGAPTLVGLLSPVGEGEGMGLYSAAGALGAVGGAMLGGYTAQLFGFRAVPAAGACCMLVALMAMARVRNGR
jgi:MFS family permease